jgi:hypothetical protein
MKPKIWIYWDNKPGITQPPEYIRMCWETIVKHCGESCDINFVTTENVKQFLPSISDVFFNIAQINNKSNYLRYHLLHEHGGIWLDSDLVVLKDLAPMLDLLKDDIDLVATASPSLKYQEPESGFLVSEPKGKLITRAAQYIDHMLNLQAPGHIFQWGSLGPACVRHAVRGHRYHHLDCRLMQPIPSWEAFRFSGVESIDNYYPDGYGWMLFHQMFVQERSRILDMTRKQLLESPMLISQIFRKALSNGD